MKGEIKWQKLLKIDGKYIVCGILWGEYVEEIFDMLYETEALKKQIEIIEGGE